MKQSPRVSLLCAAALVSIGASAFAQGSRNVTLLSSVRPNDRFNDVWGWHDPATGREAAILGGVSNTFIIETTNPRSPVIRATFAVSRSGWSRSTWQDMKAWKGYAYCVTERGSGLRIIDMRNLNSPRLLSTWGTNLWSHAHNVALDRDRGILIVHGTGGRSGETVRFIDVNTNPASPRLIASARMPYQHDLSMQNGILYGAEIYAGRLAIYDVRNMNSPTLLSRITTPRFFTHNTWPTFDDKICVTTDERSNGPMAIYDVSNKRSPRYLAKYHAGPTTSIIHNAYVQDYVAHMSHYTEGYRTVDISNPSRPVEVGFYDNYTGSSSGYNGHWGCYCFQPSGIVYAADISRGLLVLKPKSTSVRYGKGTAGTGSKVPYAHTIGCGYLGNSAMKLAVRDARASSVGVAVLGGGRASLSVGGLNINVNLVGAIIATAPTGTNGRAVVPLPIPTDTRLNGLKLNSQWFVVDSNGSLGLSASRGLEFETFTR